MLSKGSKNTVGIFGGGQLGKMTAMAAAQLGYKTHIFSDVKDAPAIQVTSSYTIADFHNKEALISFAKSVNVVVLEFENIPHITIEILSEHVDVYPNWKTLYIAQNRLREKNFISKELKISVVDYIAPRNYDDIRNYLVKYGYPALLKTEEFGYDGKGQYFIGNEQDLINLCSLNWNKKYILERFIKIYKEISLIIVIDCQKNAEFFPVAENYHVNGILDKSVVPAQIEQSICDSAKEIVFKIASSLDLIGILAVEFFITEDGNLLVNEIAPRPHNSGHWSLNACNVSQFEQLVRAICRLPMKPVKLFFPCVMKNILGKDINNYYKYLSDSNANLTIYGKDRVEDKRKMGHVNILDY